MAEVRLAPFNCLIHLVLAAINSIARRRAAVTRGI